MQRRSVTTSKDPESPLSLVLPAEPASVAVVRRAVRGRLSDWELPELLEPLALSVSELATNAVLHARGLLRVTLRREGAAVRLEVGDESPRLPQQRRHSSLSGTGRGLGLVASLATDWGAEQLAGGGKVVWAVFATGRGGSGGPSTSRDWLADH